MKNNRTDGEETQSNAAIAKPAELKFKCPDCGKDELLMLTVANGKITFFVDGGFELGDIRPYSGEASYRCAACGYELRDAHGYCISDLRDALRWMFEQHIEEIEKHWSV
jgi:predicted RNA-binding Zn-ribbon protein involved in translation (DUF1610 family)